jgi:hypothetical protein
MKSVAYEHDPLQTKWLRTCLRLSSSENFKYAWLDLASLIAPFVIDSAAIRPATNDPIRWPPRAAARRSKLICAGDKLFRTPLRRRVKQHGVVVGAIVIFAGARQQILGAVRPIKLRFGSRPAVSRRSAYRPTGSSPKSSSFDNRRNYCEHSTERAELPQAVQRLIFGIQYRKDGIKAHDVKDLLDRFL